MFNKNKYISEFNKLNYRDLKLRIRKDDYIVLSTIDRNKNINKYIRDLIYEDALKKINYRYINDEFKINFALSKTMKQLVNKAEEADFLDDYGLYMNIVDAIDSQAKKETNNHIIRESQWKQLIRRYAL
ncbi:MAG: hypothetical protein MJ206_02120 [Bacilli bacterium]|nr:hypothetical protein [Bacilli bacterium]